MEWHAYAWAGMARDKEDEGRRRPSSPDFLSSPLPPMRLCDWLLKPAGQIRSTIKSADEGLDWLAEMYRAVTPSLDFADQEARIGLDWRLANAAQQLPHGVDVQWSLWLTGGRFTIFGVICCPNRHAPYPCPIKRTK